MKKDTTKNDTIHAVIAMQLVNEAYNKLHKYIKTNRNITYEIFLMDVVTRGLNDILTNRKPSVPVDEAIRLHNILQEM